jgi:transglutaminase-like putative cysteine protease
MLLHTICTLRYEVEEETLFVFNIRPSRSDGQIVHDERLTVAPGGLIDDIRDDGAWNRLTRVLAAPGPLTVIFEALGEPVSEPPAARHAGNDLIDYPPDVFPFLEQSRYCASDMWSATAVDMFGDLDKAEAPAAITAWIKDNITYTPGASDGQTTAVETFIQRHGVCRDFAHLAITFCRSLQIPARYTASYAWQLDPPDFHAVFEAYIDGRWQIFDPTGLSDTDHLLRIDSGLDAAQVASASIFGTAQLVEMSVAVQEGTGKVL